MLQLQRLIQPFDTFSLSSQPLLAPQNLSPTQTRNSIYHPHKIFNISDKSIPSFSVQKLQVKLELEDSSNIYQQNFELQNY